MTSINQQADEIYSKTVTKMVLDNKYTFFINLLFDLPVIWDDSQPTAYVNQSVMGINPQFFIDLSKEERIAVLVHEILHVAYDHVERLLQYQETSNFDTERWQAACDYRVNWDCHEAGLTVPSWMAYFDAKYSKGSVEQIYKQLEGRLFKKDNKVKDLDPKFFDKAGTTADKSSAPNNITRLFKAAMLTEMQKAEHTIPTEVKNLLTRLRDPVIDWQSKLKKTIARKVKQAEINWKSPSRRLLSQGYYLPSIKGYTTDPIHFAIDVSGSVSETAFKNSCAEVYGVLKTFKPSAILLSQFDTQVTKTEKITKADQIRQVVFKGGGGTDLVHLFECFEANKEATMLVVLTDGYFCNNFDKPKRPVVWAVYNNSQWEPPFGEVIHFQLEQ